MFTYDELLDKIYHSTDGSLQLSYDEACIVQKILVNRGYCVMMSGGDIGDDYKISWVYAGAVGNLNFADSDRVIFCDTEYMEMLLDKDYVEDEE